MKSSIIYLISILTLATNLVAQEPQSEGTNSPGENITTYDNNETELSIESQYTRLQSRTEIKKNKIEPLYFVEEQVMAYGGGFETVTRKVKTTIYGAGQILLDDHYKTLNSLSSQDIESRIEVLREISEVQDQLLYFAEAKKTRSVKKQLKKLEKPEEIEPIFFQKVKN